MALSTKNVNANTTVLLCYSGDREYLLLDTNGNPASGGYTTPFTPSAPDCYANFTPLSDMEIDVDSAYEILAANGYRFWGARSKRKK